MIRIAWDSIFCHPLPENHRFPMEKYRLLPEQLIYEGTISASQLFSPQSICESDLLTTHDAEYVNKLNTLTLTPAEIRRTGFPLSEALVLREKTIMQGTIDAAQFALKYGVAFNSAGGTHHAFSNKGEGFCLLNDIAIAANVLLNKKLANKVLVIDLDVHQGNGTASIFKDKNEVFTFSMHGVKNYPLHKEQSDLDIELNDFTDDDTYLKLLDYHLKQLIDTQKPDFIFYQAGVDVLEEDKLGRLSLSLDGCKQRDYLVLKTCQENSIPVAVSMGGGYSPNIKTIIEAHANTYRVAQHLFG